LASVVCVSSCQRQSIIAEISEAHRLVINLAINWFTLPVGKVISLKQEWTRHQISCEFSFN